MVTQARIDAVLDIVRARHAENPAVVAVADALMTALQQAEVALAHVRPPQAGRYAYPYVEVAATNSAARALDRVEILYDVLALALQRLGETVERG